MRALTIAFALLLVCLASGLASDPAWHATEQPELKEALEHAPVLQTESLGEPARGVNVWERWMVPNPDGKSWDVLQIYFKEYYGPTWLFAIDLGTGQVKKQRLPDGHQFYLSGRTLGFDCDVSCMISPSVASGQKYRRTMSTESLTGPRDVSHSHSLPVAGVFGASALLSVVACSLMPHLPPAPTARRVAAWVVSASVHPAP